MRRVLRVAVRAGGVGAATIAYAQYAPSDYTPQFIENPLRHVRTFSTAFAAGVDYKFTWHRYNVDKLKERVTAFSVRDSDDGGGGGEAAAVVAAAAPAAAEDASAAAGSVAKAALKSILNVVLDVVAGNEADGDGPLTEEQYEVLRVRELACGL